jgi:hypothetical protein
MNERYASIHHPGKLFIWQKKPAAILKNPCQTRNSLFIIAQNFTFFIRKSQIYYFFLVDFLSDFIASGQKKLMFVKCCGSECWRTHTHIHTNYLRALDVDVRDIGLVVWENKMLCYPSKHTKSIWPNQTQKKYSSDAYPPSIVKQK